MSATTAALRPRLVKRLLPSRATRLAVRIGAVAAAFVAAALFLLLAGNPIGPVFSALWSGSFGSAYGQAQTILAAIPLVFTSLAVAIAFRMLLWNIGAEGQFYFGAFGAAAVAYAWPEWPGPLLLTAMVLGGMLGGALWALVPGALRAYLGVNEIVPTLLLNYVAILWVDYLVNTAWRDPESLGFPLGVPFSAQATLPQLGDTAVHAGAIIAVIAALVIAVILRKTIWGYKIKVIGENRRAARYAGFSITRNIVGVMLLSGALAGVGGMVEVSGTVHRIQADISPGFGYTGIIVATLARFSPLLILPVALLFGALITGGVELQTIGLPSDIVLMLQGTILFFALAGELLVHYRIEWRRQAQTGSEGEPGAAGRAHPGAMPSGT
ncbi:MAG: ABC transporter permease [Actinobacteria bacterium]|nr:ABC transporter permease [Actinomycetota bacterium]